MQHDYQQFNLLDTQSKKPKFYQKRLFWSLAVATLVLIAGTWYVTTSMDPFGDTTIEIGDNQDAVSDTQHLLAAVGELIILPEDEHPTIATVEDPQELEDHPFFRNAQKGYKILLYPGVGKAILYDPDRHRIIEIAPLSTDNTDQ